MSWKISLNSLIWKERIFIVYTMTEFILVSLFQFLQLIWINVLAERVIYFSWFFPSIRCMVTYLFYIRGRKQHTWDIGHANCFYFVRMTLLLRTLVSYLIFFFKKFVTSKCKISDLIYEWMFCNYILIIFF